MEIINITEEQRDKLCSELARLTFELRKDKRIKCIYFAPFEGLGSISGNFLEVTLVRDGSKYDDLDEKIKEYNISHQYHNFIREFGFKIFLDTDEAVRYATMNSNSSEWESINNLMHSTILYDENGKFTKIKEQITNVVKNNEKTFSNCYDNLAEVFPPLDETLDKAIDNARMERDTQDVKEFTKSKLFQYIKNM